MIELYKKLFQNMFVFSPKFGMECKGLLNEIFFARDLICTKSLEWTEFNVKVNIFVNDSNK